MKDNEIIKALECCSALDKDCQKCLYNERFGNICIHFLCKDTVDLINRQNAEIDRLEDILDKKVVEFAYEKKQDIKSEAYKEFAEWLKTEYAQGINWFGVKEHYFVNVEDIDNLVKEMVGKNNDW